MPPDLIVRKDVGDIEVSKSKSKPKAPPIAPLPKVAPLPVESLSAKGKGRTNQRRFAGAGRLATVMSDSGALG